MTSSRGCSGSLPRLALAGLIGVCAASAAAYDMQIESATREGDSYRVTVDALVSTPAAAVRSLMTDYAHLGRLNPSIKVSEILRRRSPCELRVRTVTEVCVLFYCKRIHQVQDVVEAQDGTVTAVIVPEQSDFRRGYARLHLWQEAAGTRVRISGELEPKFWIPPLIGGWLVRRKLLDEARETISNLEQVAPLAAMPQNSCKNLTK